MTILTSPTRKRGLRYQPSLTRQAGSLFIRTLPGDARTEALQIVLLRDGAYKSESNKIAVGHPPDALRPLRILFQPVAFGSQSRGASAILGIVAPRTAAHHVGITSFVRYQH